MELQKKNNSKEEDKVQNYVMTKRKYKLWHTFRHESQVVSERTLLMCLPCSVSRKVVTAVDSQGNTVYMLESWSSGFCI